MIEVQIVYPHIWYTVFSLETHYFFAVYCIYIFIKKTTKQISKKRPNKQKREKKKTERKEMSRTRTQHLRLVAEIQRSRRENAHLLVNPILKLTIVLIWKTPACLKFGKTSNRAVKNLPQRKLWVWAGNDARSHKNLITPNFGERVLLRKR